MVADLSSIFRNELKFYPHCNRFTLQFNFKFNEFYCDDTKADD